MGNQESMKVKVTSNLDELIELLNYGLSTAKELEAILQKINEFKLRIDTEKI